MHRRSVFAECAAPRSKLGSKLGDRPAHQCRTSAASRRRNRDQARQQTGAADRRALDAGLESAWHQSTECGSAQPESTRHGLAAGTMLSPAWILFSSPSNPRPADGGSCCMVVLLAALGGAGWWTYTNYLGAAESRKPAAATPSAGEAPAERLSTKPAAKDAAPAPDAGSSQATVPSRESGRCPENHAESPRALLPTLPEETVEPSGKASGSGRKPVSPAKREPSADLGQGFEIARTRRG